MTKSFQLRMVLGILTMTLGWGSVGKGADLLLIHGERQVPYTTEALLKHPLLKSIAVNKDPAYGESKRMYRGVPLTELFKPLGLTSDEIRDSTLSFKCLDGFSGPIRASRVLNEKTTASRAYIAVEDPETPWDPIAPAKSRASAGPFYLVWENPEKSRIGREEWPFQLASFEVKPGLRTTYPGIFPPGQMDDSHPAMRGLQVYVRQCFVCHRMNGEGTADVGPDLNLPMNPTEYFQTAALKKYIRAPESVRTWKAQSMIGFPEDQITNSELEDLIAYLKALAPHKKRRP